MNYQQARHSFTHPVPSKHSRGISVLTKVYLSLLSMTFLCAVGVAVNIFYLHLNQSLSSLLGFIVLIVIIAQKFSNVSQITKFVTLCIFGFVEGLTISSLVAYVLDLDPSILVIAFMGTSVIFALLSLSAHYGRDNYLHMGGILGMILSLMCMVGFLNTFFRHEWMFVFQLYVGLVVFGGYVLYDTQKIMFKIKRGGEDYVGYALDLFLDLIGIFVRILIILARNKKKKKKDEDD